MADQKSSRVATNLAYSSAEDAGSCASQLPQRSSFFIPAFQLHAFNVSGVLVRPKELQAFLRIAPLPDFDRLLTRAPGIHLALVRHVKVDGPAVIFYSVTLSGGK